MRQSNFICLYLEPYTYIALKRNHLLLYNTLDGKYIEDWIDISCMRVFSYFIESKCYSQSIDKQNISQQLWKIIYYIKKKFMGDYYPIYNINDVLPFSFPFDIDFNLHKNNNSLDSILRTEVNLTKYVSVLHIYPSLWGKKEITNIYFHKYKTDISLPNFILEKLKVLVEQPSTILQLPGEPSIILQLMKYYGEKYIINKCVININYVYIDKVKLLPKVLLNKEALNIYINLTDPDKIFFMEDEIEYTSFACFHFLIENSKQYNLAKSLIYKHNITKYIFTLNYNGENLSFFQKYVYLSKKDILSQPHSKQDIFTNTTLNKMSFGKLSIFPNGQLYSDIHDKSLGNLKQSTIEELIYKEMTQRNIWLNTRNQKPCKNCIFQYLCPPPSQYERMLKRLNLCNVFTYKK